MFVYEEILKTLGLAKNEARIYETLLLEGESSAAHIAQKSKVHRRNVYDTLQRLIEKGLVYEILQSKENIYQVVDPKKLSEILQEKENALGKVLLDMEELYKAKRSSESVYIYRGLEGWKNYMRDILRIGEDMHAIAAKGVWGDQKIKSFTEQFATDARKKGISFKWLFDADAKKRVGLVNDILQVEYRYLPPQFKTKSSIDIFGDQVVIVSDCSNGVLDDDLSLTVVANKKVADSFRVWFQLMWEASTP
jgi:sugar-specific transcriptional regulator TrmB